MTMEKENVQRTRLRKEYKRDEVTQKMMAFRVDLENAEWLKRFQNKGRYINDLIAQDRVKCQ